MDKVAIVSTIQPETHYTRYLYKELKNINENIYLLIDDIPENDEFVEGQKDKNIIKLWKANLSLPFAINRFVKLNNISIVHLQHEFNMYGGIKGIPIFLFTMIFLKIVRKNIVVTTHAVVDYRTIDNDFLETFVLDKFKRIKDIAKIAFYLFYKVVGLIADKVIVHSNFTKQIYIDSYKIKESKCFVIPIGVNNLSSVIANDKGLDSKTEWSEEIKGKNIILYFGYILKRKGLELLIQAISSLKNDIPDNVVVLAGGMLENQKGYVDYLKKMITEKGLTKEIIFTGFLSKKEIDFLYNKCDFVVLPYTYSISSSLPLSLAFEAGKPVIASDIGTLRDEIIDNVNGLFFKNGDLKELCDKIYLLSTNNNLLRRLQNGAKREFGIRSWAKIAKLTNEVIYSNKKPN
ncbi:MAG: glycosyltransferase family 4 protein [bacterium]|nr:glycosyltransferase family 4 protein [bacterium]